MSLTEETLKFLDLATHKKHHEKPVVLVESDEVVHSRIDDASSAINKIFGNPYHVAPEVDQSICYTGKCNQGNTYNIHRVNDDEWVVKFTKPSGKRGEFPPYPTFNGALYMLQAQVPSLVSIRNDMEPVKSEEPQTPVDYVALDSLKHDSPLDESFNDNNDRAAKLHASMVAFANGKAHGLKGFVKANAAKLYGRNEDYYHKGYALGQSEREDDGSVIKEDIDNKLNKWKNAISTKYPDKKVKFVNHLDLNDHISAQSGDRSLGVFHCKTGECDILGESFVEPLSSQELQNTITSFILEQISVDSVNELDENTRDELSSIVNELSSIFSEG